MEADHTGGDYTDSTDATGPSRRDKSVWGVLVLLLAAAILALLFLTQCSARVPDVVGLSRTAATAKLQASGYKTGAISYITDTSRPAGTVTEQVPTANTAVKKGGAVDLFVSRGDQLVKVPDVVGLKLGEAGVALEKSGLVMDETDVYNETVPDGTVIEQSPVAGDRVLSGSEIAVTVSIGPAPATSSTSSGTSGGAAGSSAGDGSTGSGRVQNVFTKAYPDASTYADGGDIYVRLTSGASARRVTSGSAWDSVPQVSPAGTYIVFLRASSSGSKPTQVCIVNLTTMNATSLELPISTRRPAKDVWYDKPVFAPQEGSTALSSVWIVIPQLMTPAPTPDARLLVCNVPEESSWASWNVDFFPTGGIDLLPSSKASCVRVVVQPSSNNSRYDADFNCYTGWYTPR